MIIADEIYDGLDFTHSHVSVASRSNDVPVFAKWCLKGILCSGMENRILQYTTRQT